MTRFPRTPISSCYDTRVTFQHRSFGGAQTLRSEFNGKESHWLNYYLLVLFPWNYNNSTFIPRITVFLLTFCLNMFLPFTLFWTVISAGWVSVPLIQRGEQVPACLWWFTVGHRDCWTVKRFGSQEAIEVNIVNFSSARKGSSQTS